MHDEITKNAPPSSGELTEMRKMKIRKNSDEKICKKA